MAVPGHDSPREVESRWAFRELGVDSRGALEIRNRLQAFTQPCLAPSLLFDQPTLSALAAHLLWELVGAPRGRPRLPRSCSTREEPIAIIGMGCRYPGGISWPGDLWELVLAGRDAIGEFPRDRGWDVEGWYGSDPDRLAKLFVHRRVSSDNYSGGP